MNKQDFNIINGFPLNQAALDRLQTAYSIFNALGNIVGDKTIISGCVVTNTNTSGGVVFVNGELFEFKGGVTQATVIIKEDITNLVFKNNNSYPAVKTRYIQFGSGVNEMNWSDFKQGFQTKNIEALVQRIVALEARPIVGNIPVDLIALWGRPANEIPLGWIEYTPLAGRTAVGFNEDDPDFDVVGKPGRSKKVKLTAANIPELEVKIKKSSSTSGGLADNFVVNINNNAGETTLKVNSGSSATDVVTLNPYRTVHYIQYKG